VALHAREMKKHGIEIEIWAFETWPGMYARSKARLDNAHVLSNSNIRLFRGLFYYIPFSETINSLLLVYYLRRFRPKIDFIHARADYAATVSGCASKVLHIPIIWDCRGDTEAEFKTAYNPSGIAGRLFKVLFLGLIRWRTSFASWVCTRAIFVSEELRHRKWKYGLEKPSEIIPTSVAPDIFFFSEDLRKEARESLCITPEKRVLLYSGSIVGYQHFEEYVRMCKKLNRSDSRLRFLVVTPHIERARRVLLQLPQRSWILCSASLKEMNAYYNAADFGVLLRERNSVNDVASPTKFGEYCLTGLPVIMNDSVKQSFKYALEFAKILSRDTTALKYQRVYDYSSKLKDK